MNIDPEEFAVQINYLAAVGRMVVPRAFVFAGRKVFPGLSVYSGSKFLVEALSQGLRLETAGTGIKVTTVQPGNVATDLLALSSDEEALKLYGQPGGARVLDPEDVAASVVHALRQPDHVAVNEILVEPRDEPV